MQVVNAVTMIIVTMTVMLGKSVRLTLISSIMIPGLFLFAFLFFRWVIKAFTASDQAEGRMSTVLQENLTGVRVVRAFGRQQFEIDKFGVRVKDLADKNMKVCKLLAVYWATGDAMSMLQMMITLIAGVYAVISGEITLGVMVIFTTYTGKLLFPIRQLGRILSDAGKSKVALGRIGEILAQPVEPKEKDVITPPLNGDIVFDRVTFGYDPDHPVLKDCSFTIPAGTTAALLGATGSGKSTIAELLQRLYEPQSGQITIGGTPIQRVERSWLRSRIGLVLQEPFLYSKTLRENVGIACCDPETAEIERAARDAAALDFILDSEKGWDTLVGERGVTLSGGQKQRVAIARTLMKQNDILIFDDSLSAVDTETDAAIRRALKERGRNTTTLIISHRVVTLSQADLILVIENGRVTQQGTHRQLIAQEGLYARIFNIQTALEDEFRQEVI
jgi:ATP-binding cassette subfamily B protein